MTRQELLYDLLTKVLEDRASAQDLKQLNELISEDASGELAMIATQSLIENPGAAANLRESDSYWNARIQQILAADKISSQQTADYQEISTIPVHRVHFLRKWGWAAASVVLILTIAGYFWLTEKRGKTHWPIANLESGEIQPGKLGAILTLADGSKVSLDSIKNGVIALQSGVQASVVNGALLYEGQGQEMLYNTMSTPKGRQFQITLPDGTGVWLNAASSIRFPTVFAGEERKVEITGEVYFEVAENAAAPFHVKVENKAEVEVLGTRFNINAYKDESVISTTLLSGAVRVQNERADKVNLKPGQQARIAGNTQQGAIKVLNDVVMNKVVAWKNGYFDFEGVAFDVAMRQLERWYDIDVEYENNKVPDIEFIGKITRDVSYNGLLTGLQKMGVHYKQEGRKLVILAAISQ